MINGSRRAVLGEVLSRVSAAANRDRTVAQPVVVVDLAAQSTVREKGRYNAPVVQRHCHAQQVLA